MAQLKVPVSKKTRSSPYFSRLISTGVAFLFVALSAIVMTGGPTSAAGTGGIVAPNDAKLICGDFRSPQTQSRQNPELNGQLIFLAGHNQDMITECSDPNGPPQSTVAVICRAGLSGLDGNVGSSPEDIDNTRTRVPVDAPVARPAGRAGANGALPAPAPNPNEFKPKVAINSWLSQGGLDACTRAGFCTDRIFWAQCRGSVGATPVTEPPGPLEINVSAINALSGGFAFYALAVCVIGILVAAGLWAMGNKGQHPGTELTGKRGFIVCCTAALVVGGLPTWVNHLEGFATSPDIDTNGITVSTLPINNNPDPTREERVEAENVSLQNRLKEAYDSFIRDGNAVSTDSKTWKERTDDITKVIAEQKAKGFEVGPTDKAGRVAFLKNRIKTLNCGINPSPVFESRSNVATFDIAELKELLNDPNYAPGADGLCTNAPAPTPPGQFPANIPDGISKLPTPPGATSCFQVLVSTGEPCIDGWGFGTPSQPAQFATEVWVAKASDCQLAIEKQVADANTNCIRTDLRPNWITTAPNEAGCTEALRAAKVDGKNIKICVINWKPATLWESVVSTGFPAPQGGGGQICWDDAGRKFTQPGTSTQCKIVTV